jgi:5-methyltetrahydrofolate--homocysteine methyltransferase
VSSITGFYISHPESKYFRIGKITREQVADYAKRSQVPYTNAEKRFRAIVNYKPNEIKKERQNQEN